VKLINTDGMAFIGPGSEWFWTALSGLVLAVTFIAIYRQLRLARSASAMEQLAPSQREWKSERLLRKRLDIYLALRDGTDPARVPQAAGHAITDYWIEIGLLAREGHLDRKVIDSTNCQLWWATLAPFVAKERAAWGNPATGEEFEWLAGLMAERDRRDGHQVVLYEGLLAQKLEGQISAAQDAIRVEQALRTVIIVPPEPATVGQPAPAVPSA
jgi:hypothetical protein